MGAWLGFTNAANRYAPPSQSLGMHTGSHQMLSKSKFNLLKHVYDINKAQLKLNNRKLSESHESI